MGFISLKMDKIAKFLHNLVRKRLIIVKGFIAYA